MRTKEEQKLEKTKENKIPWYKSIRTRIVGMMLLCMIALLTISTIISYSGMSDRYTNVVKNYMIDVATYTAEGVLHNGYTEFDQLEEREITTLREVNIYGLESSYAYVVSSDGTMLYHPTAEKIGQPVENEVVKGIVEELKVGNIPEPDVIEYMFNGAKKYVGCFVTPNGKYILVITCDENDVLAPIKSFRNTTIMISGILIVVGMIFAFLLSTSIAKPLVQLSDVIRKVGKLDFRKDKSQDGLNKRMDETGYMSRAIDAMQEELSSVVKDLIEDSRLLYEASEQLGSHATETAEHVSQIDVAVGEIAEGATSQANETEDATSNVVVMGTMIEDTTSKIAELEQNVQEMRRASNNAGNTLNELGKINNHAKQAIETIYKQTNMTNQSTVKIKEATALITSIAEETNLLSLNASIEAARAGENGRGFAVVAAQIQKLAEQSNETALHIDEIVSELMEDSQKAVETMAEVKEVMDKQSENVENTGEIFKTVEERINDSMEEIDSIVESSREMDKTRVTVVDSVQNLSAIAQENAAGTEETSASVTQMQNIIQNMAENAENLRQIAENVDGQMKHFKIS